MWKYQEIGPPLRIQAMGRNSDFKFALLVYKELSRKQRFRCQFIKKYPISHLSLVPIHENGNIIKLSQIESHHLVSIINKKSSFRYPGIIIYFRNGLIKIILKQRTYETQNHLASQKSFFPIMNKLFQFLNIVQLEIVWDKLFNSNKKKKRQKHSLYLEASLHHNIRKILTSINPELNESTPFRKQMPAFEKETKTADSEAKLSNIYQIKQIILPSKGQKETDSKNISGGVCIIQEKACDRLVLIQDDFLIQKKMQKIIIKTPKIQKTSSEEIQLARKQRKKMRFKERFSREIEIIKYINKKQGKRPYMLNYYQNPANSFVLYLDALELNLYEFLFYYRESLSIRELFFICRSVLQIIQDLHKVGIVHRDLKLSNFMVDLKDGLKVKIIDFSDSSIIDPEENYPNEGIFGTLPYSPLECSSKSQFYEEKGKINKQIDYWSAGILLFQIFYGYLPLVYSSLFSRDIHSLWISQFLYLPKPLKKGGILAIEKIIHRIFFMMVQVDQKDRLSITKALLCIKQLENYFENLDEDANPETKNPPQQKKAFSFSQ